MQKLNDFLEMIHVKEKPLKLWALIVVPSILYCLMLSFVRTLIYMGNPWIYYSALYFFLLLFGFVWLLVFFQFLNQKRGNTMHMQMKSYLMPYLVVQTVFFLIMMGCNYFTMQVAGDPSKQIVFYILNFICIILTLIYIPWQLFCCFEILDGKKNPLSIMKDSFMKLVKQYQICFYALFVLALVAVIFAFCKEAFFQIPMNFVPYVTVHDVMVLANPFIDAIEAGIFAMKDASQWFYVLVSFTYGILMSVLLVGYYMVMACIYDGELRIS